MYRLGLGVNPWRDLRRLEGLMDSMFTGFRGREGGADFPAVNLWSNGDDTVLRAEVPGVEAADLDISIKGRTVTIRGSREPEKTAEGETYHRRERWHGRFARTIEVPYTVEAGKVEARFVNGVLTVTLPRAEAEKPRKITVTNN